MRSVWYVKPHADSVSVTTIATGELKHCNRRTTSVLGKEMANLQHLSRNLRAEQGDNFLLRSNELRGGLVPVALCFSLFRPFLARSNPSIFSSFLLGLAWPAPIVNYLNSLRDPFYFPNPLHPPLTRIHYTRQTSLLRPVLTLFTYYIPWVRLRYC